MEKPGNINHNVQPDQTKKKCHIYISDHDHNGFIASILSQSFFWSLKNQLSEHYTIEVVLPQDNLHLLGHADLSVVYGHGGIWGDPDMTIRRQMAAPLIKTWHEGSDLILWGCSSYITLIDNPLYIDILPTSKVIVPDVIRADKLPIPKRESLFGLPTQGHDSSKSFSPGLSPFSGVGNSYPSKSKHLHLKKRQFNRPFGQLRRPSNPSINTIFASRKITWPGGNVSLDKNGRVEEVYFV